MKLKTTHLAYREWHIEYSLQSFHLSRPQFYEAKTNISAFRVLVFVSIECPTNIAAGGYSPAVLLLVFISLTTKTGTGSHFARQANGSLPSDPAKCVPVPAFVAPRTKSPCRKTVDDLKPTNPYFSTLSAHWDLRPSPIALAVSLKTENDPPWSSTVYSRSKWREKVGGFEVNEWRSG